MTPGELLSVIAGVLLVILLIVLAVICTPVTIKAVFDTSPKTQSMVTLGLFAGLVPIPIPVGGDAEAEAEEHKHKTDRKKKKRKSRLAVNWRSGLHAVPPLLSRIRKRIHIEKFAANIRFGFPDPADTGLLYGLAVPVTMWTGDTGKFDFVLQPDFERARLDGIGKLAVRLTPVLLITPFIGFGWVIFAPKPLQRAFS